MVSVGWREGGLEPCLVTPGEVLSLTVDLGLVGHAFQPGHRIRVQVTSSAFPHLDRNLNTGRCAEAEIRGVVAEQTVHRSRGYPSGIALPVMGS